PLPIAVVGVWDERLAVRGGEDPALTLPDLARAGAFLLLLGPVGLEQGDELGRQADRAAARLRLDPAGRGPGVHALRAEAGRLAAGAPAAVRVLGAQPGLVDADRSLSQ